jgi:SAM-dependent methyltransferase
MKGSAATLWRQRFRRLRRPAWVGVLRRTKPLSDTWGFDRGNPVDRYYIEQFLDEHRADIRGRVLEIRSSTYTDRFGAGVVGRDVVDIDATNARATIIADLSGSEGIPESRFDCCILTQTLQFILDTRAVIANLYRMLRPGGVLLVTVPSISRIAPRYGLERDYWRFTAASCRALFGDRFGPAQVMVRSYGNVLAAVAFLMGMAAEELRPRQLDTIDEYFPTILAVRAVKPGSPGPADDG